MGIVYCAEEIHSGFKYIGITVQTLEIRKKNHINSAHNPLSHEYNRPFKKALRDNSKLFKQYIIEEVDSIVELKKLEKYYINKFRTYIKFDDCKGYNATLGGEGVSVYSDEIYRVSHENYQVIEKYKTSDDVVKKFGTKVSVLMCCIGNRNTVYGDVWYYKSDYESMKKEVIIQDIDYRVNKFYVIDKDLNILQKFNTLHQLFDFFERDPIKVFQKSSENGICFAKDFYNKEYSKGLYFIEKPVLQYDLNGKFINLFPSIRDAVKKTGCKKPSIQDVCEHRKVTTHNYQWRYVLDNTPVLPTKAGRDRVIREVSQYDKEGNYLRTFETVTEAGAYLGIDGSAISKVCNGHKQTCKGYRWRYGSDKSKLEPLQIYEFNQKKAVFHRDINGKEYIFESIADAGRFFDISPVLVSRYCYSGIDSPKRGFWCFYKNN